ncbi:ankyrin repeat domain-containing protein, partial [Endozoicomonas sp. SESOKO1]|uniref:ankyrin repeat domain-containing protein n=1 Tax=Endozoicomonas sp. SESOKO1 TaxID=2828742 RepID=UPI0021482CA7
MQVSNTDLQPPNYGKTFDEANLNKQVIRHARFADSSVATTSTLPQITTPERYAPISPADRIAGASCQVINPDDAVSITGRNASESLKRSFNNDPGYESTLCKLMKNESFAIPADSTNQDDFIKTLVTAITDIDTSNAKRLIFEYGAAELSRYRCSFSSKDTTYPDITPFALACRLGKLDLVEGLYVNQEQLNQTFDNSSGGAGRTSLMLAVMSGDVDVVEQLLKWGANPQIPDKAGHVVDIINVSFNRGDTRNKIRNLLIEHREELGLEPFEEPAIHFLKTECTDEGTGHLNKYNVYL